MLALILAEDVPHVIEFRVGERIGDGLLEVSDSFVVHHLCRGQFKPLDLLTGGAFDGGQHTLFPGGHKQDGIAGPASASGAPDPVNVRFSIVGDVVVDDMADSRHIESSRCHIGCDQDIEAAPGQIVDLLFP